MGEGYSELAICVGTIYGDAPTTSLPLTHCHTVVCCREAEVPGFGSVEILYGEDRRTGAGWNA